MALLDRNTWYILRHLHQDLAAQAASRIEAGEHIPASAWLVCRARADDRLARMDVAEVDSDFLCELLARNDGEQLLARYLTEALQEGSNVQQHIAHEYALQPLYTVCVQETRLPNADSRPQAREALLVLIRARHFVLPVFHLIRQQADGRRLCQLRPFPELQEIDSVQPLLQAAASGHATLH